MERIIVGSDKPHESWATIKAGNRNRIYRVHSYVFDDGILSLDLGAVPKDIAFLLATRRIDGAKMEVNLDEYQRVEGAFRLRVECGKLQAFSHIAGDLDEEFEFFLEGRPVARRRTVDERELDLGYLDDVTETVR